ncbi:MAG: DUF4340 domain-containing protein [Wenzhouxiangellaceae bacterium]|nr:DUF4340 domain-containing protein [Wenzhouxiangellaceae bacterium]MBS3745448.1 DUF4340 domain-containing protein [Wenzhouxiangellaceae bacterium]
MNRNRFLMLVAVTLAAAVLVALLDRPERSNPEEIPATLLPGLDEAVNRIAAVDVVAPGGKIAVSLRRDEDRWRVPEKDGYEADFAQVVAFLRTLAEVGAEAPKTDDPDWYSRLGVQSVEAPDATGRRIDFPGREFASVIIGQADPSGEGSYARRAGEQRSWLLDRIVEVPVDPVAWLEPGIMDIPSSDIARVVIRHADGAVVRLDRAGDSDPVFVLRDVPEGREAGGEWKRNAIANGLRGLNLEDVRRFEPPLPEDATRVLFTTTDGLNFVAALFERDDAHWVHFTVSAENAAEPAEAATDPAQSMPDADEVDASGDGEKAAGERLANAVGVDSRLSPWLFAIPERRYDDLTRRMEDLLAPLEDEQVGAASPADVP